MLIQLSNEHGSEGIMFTQVVNEHYKQKTIFIQRNKTQKWNEYKSLVGVKFYLKYDIL